jgi:hypothetical protein
VTAFLAALTTRGPWARSRNRVRAGRGLRRLCAWVLVALVAAPFTSPFSTCDLRALSSVAASTSAHPIAPLSTGAVLLAARDTDGGPVSIEEETFKDDVVLIDAALLLESPAARPVPVPVLSATSDVRTPLVALRL